MTDSNTVLIRALTTLGGIVIAAFTALAIFGSPNNTVINAAIGPIVTVVTLLISGLLTMKVASEAKTEAIKSKDASRQNATVLNAVESKLSEANTGIDTVHGIVNAQRTAMELQIKELHDALAEVQKTLAVERAVTGATPLANVIPVPQVSDAPPHGSTPAHDTPIAPPPKGKRPEIGDQH